MTHDIEEPAPAYDQTLKRLLTDAHDGVLALLFPQGRWRGEREPGLHYPFDVIRLWQVPADRVLASPHVRLWPLAALMAGSAAESTRAAALGIATADLPRAERGELAGLLVVLAGIRLPRATVRALVRSNPMIRDIIEASSFAQLLREEGEVKGRQEGEVKGRQEGRQEGRQAGQREMAQAILTARFGAVAADEIAAIERADEAMLHALAQHLATDSRPQVRAWLSLPPEPAG